MSNPEMIGMVAATLSEALGKMVVLICSQHPDLIDKILEGATHNAFEVAAKFKASVVKIKPDGERR